MKSRYGILTGTAAALGMFVLILDSWTAISGAAVGVELCVKSVIPSLFPFFFLSAILTGILTGRRLPILSPIGKLCGIPQGSESILLTGLLGGYPIGAQCISQAFASGQLHRQDAQRMLGFCSNAGPAFLFGIAGRFFSSPAVPYLLWCVHIFSALAVGALLPGNPRHPIVIETGKPLSPAQAMIKSLRSMAAVCGWVILFRTLIAFLQRWVLWLLPPVGQLLVSGILELTNGCLELGTVTNERLRFLLASVFLALGGVCVAMQTMSAVSQAGLDGGLYFPGKLLQGCISFFLASLMVPFLFPHSQWEMPAQIWLPVGLLTGILLLKIRKNNSSIPVGSVV